MSRYQHCNTSLARVVRALAEAWQAFERYAGAHVRATGLSAPQFDVICTLGGTEGLTFSELGQRTLIYKTTLTGVVDRLEHKGLVDRVPCEADRRCVYVRLSGAGRECFDQVFPAHIQHLATRLDRMDEAELAETERVLRRLEAVLNEPDCTGDNTN